MEAYHSSVKPFGKIPCQNLEKEKIIGVEIGKTIYKTSIAIIIFSRIFLFIFFNSF
jgi:hypothetical protein